MPPSKKAPPARPRVERSKKPSPSKPAPRPPRRGGWLGWLLVLVGGVVAGLLAVGVVLFLDARGEVRAWRGATKAEAPSTVWSAPIRLHAGDPYTPDDLRADLLAAGYEVAAAADRPGRFAQSGGAFTVSTAPLKLPGGTDVPGGKATVRLAEGRVAEVTPATVILRPTRLATIGDLDAERAPVTQAQLPPYVAAALLAIEDARFQEHVGVDPIGLLRALIHDLRGEDLHGGSTLTQQLAKNLFLGRERTLRRKVREAFLALALEAELDKTRLLDLYLSEVYLGSSGGMPLHGVEQAARAWFGKPAASLTVAEAATIAGTIASPNAWSPLRDPDAALSRRNVVLGRMFAVRALTEAQTEAAKAEPLVLRGTPPSAGWRLPWAVDAALEEASDLHGAALPPGVAVYTTVQPHLQRAAERAVRGALATLAETRPEAAGAEGALVAVDASDGDVVAVVGGRDWAKSPFHRAIRAQRQAGSTVKPLLVLAALEADPALALTTVFDDAPLERRVDGRTWRPKDHDGQFLGPLTLRRAVELSRNVPAVLLSERLGLSKLQRALRACGLTKATDLPSSALGAFPTTVLQLAGAYTAFPEGGVAHRPHVVDAVVGPDGEALLVVAPTSERVASAASAALATSVLQGVLTHGTAKKVVDRGLAPDGLGGKTGTTDEGRDAWFVGFDARLVVATWVGADRGDLGLGGSEAALPVWAAFMLDAGRPRGTLPRPDGVVDVEVCTTTWLPACDDCAERRTERFRTGYVPASSCAAAPPVAPAAPPDNAPTTEEPREAPASPRPVRLEPVRRDARPGLPQRRLGAP